jgi:molybdenum cofactor cytidylyltransferase
MTVDGVVLAAGFSQRAGRFKPILDLLGVPVLERCIRNMSPVCDYIIVVGGHRIEEIVKITRHLPKVTVVKNEFFEQGMFSSVQCGIRSVKGDRFFIIPGDQPVVKTETFIQLMSVDGEIVIPRYNGKKGHPVLFDSRLIPEILALSPTAILRDFIHSKTSAVVDVEDPGIGMDIDTNEDFKRVERYIQEKMQ